MEGLKIKDGDFEVQEKHPNNRGTNLEQKLAKYGRTLPYCDGRVAPTITGRLLLGESFGANYLPRTVGPTLPSPFLHWKLKLQILNRGTSNQGRDLGKDLDPILQAQEDSYQLVSEHPPLKRKLTCK
ncbi:hypothetical protein M9H77_16670 [Catharanthus roseus]|uniref:Uncharacterized protein n=1 Tax=Catharanthus roseus TaxID=4058 RepID=A0ACC0B2L1_CATRO|nr:hypothetical protein M9H77_16670 [Catharanthus roseus]